MGNGQPQRNQTSTYPRLRAPVYFTRAGVRFLCAKKPADHRLGGVRVYTDEKTKVGTRLDIEIFLPDGSSILCEAEVAWVETLPAGGPARHDVGLVFVVIHPHDRERLSALVEDGKGDVPP